MDTTTKIQIAKDLRSKGSTYESIAEVLGCNISTAYAYVNKQRKFRDLETSKLRDKHKPLYDKIYEFHRRNIIREHGARASRKSTTKVAGLVKLGFTPEAVLEKSQGVCYLTGRPLDLNDSAGFQLDHIVPSSQGGDSTLENCGVACKQANWAKGDMTKEEFFQLCLDVVNHNKLK